jgi:hypothetical protein
MKPKTISNARKIKNFLFDNTLVKIIVFTIVYIALILMLEDAAEDHSIRISITIINVIMAVFLILIMIYVMRQSMKKILASKQSAELLAYYVVFFVGLIVIFSTILNIIELSQTGYITYSTCSDDFNPSMVATDPQISHSFFYYTTMLFTTIGNGDICPMGLAKDFSIVSAIIGHLVAVILVAIIINNHFRIREK